MNDKWVNKNKAYIDRDIVHRPFGRRDFILSSAIVVLALGIAGVAQILTRRSGKKLSDGPYVVIQNPEGIVYSAPLSEDYELDLKTQLGENLVKIENNKVWVERADCDNQVCVHTGKIANLGEVIVCLPHKTIIQIVAHPDDAALMNYGR